MPDDSIERESARNEAWTALRTQEPPEGVPIVMRCTGSPQVPMRQWRLARLTDFPLIEDMTTAGEDIPGPL